MRIEGLSIFISCGHFDEGIGTILEISVDRFCEIILKSNNWPKRRCHLKLYLFNALVAILFSRAE